MWLFLVEYIPLYDDFDTGWPHHSQSSLKNCQKYMKEREFGSKFPFFHMKITPDVVFRNN